MSLLTACANTVYETELEIYCPDIVSYSNEFNARLIDELQALPPDSVEDPSAIVIAIANYATLRRQIENCTKQRDSANGN